MEGESYKFNTIVILTSLIRFVKTKMRKTYVNCVLSKSKYPGTECRKRKTREIRAKRCRDGPARLFYAGRTEIDGYHVKRGFRGTEHYGGGAPNK